MSDSFTQAQVAVDQEDWSTLVLLLQQVLLHPAPTAPVAPDLEDWVPLAMQGLREGDFHAQWEVAKVLPQFGPAVIAPLIALLQDDTAEFEARWYAARILGELNNGAAIQALVEQLQVSTDEDLNEIVAAALAQLGPAGIAALAELLQVETTRLLALKALVRLPEPSIIPALLSVCQDPNPTIRVMALEALSAFDEPQLAEVFGQGIRDPVAQVRRVAIANLGGHPDWVTTGQLLPLLVERLWDLNLRVCQQAALTLGKVGGEAAVPWLKRVLLAQNTPFDLQYDVMLALSWIGSLTALKTLQECLTASPTPLTEAAIADLVPLLGRWPDAACHGSIVQALASTLEQPSAPLLRQAIATALGTLKHPAGLDLLIQLLGDADPSVRLHAIAALQQVDPVVAYTRLTGLQSRQDLSESLRDGVIVALREWNARLPH